MSQVAGQSDAVVRTAPPAGRPGSLRDWLRVGGALTLMGLAVLSAQACCRKGPEPAGPELPALAPVTAADRILIIAPHEDDEALGAGGLIQQALAAGAAVRVVYLTYGDHNELAFMAYRKKPWVSPTINRNMGELRRNEALAASARLGLPREASAFLGYPDHGTLEIWKEHWGQSPPKHSRLTNARSVPYPDALSFGKAHKGENLAADLVAQLLDFRPTRVLVGHPADGNPDHRACWLFVQEALLETAGRLGAPEVLAYPIHAGKWPLPGGEHTDQWLVVPKRLADGPGCWAMLTLTPEQARLKAQAIRLYRSQTSISAGYLLSFARRNELFARIPPVKLRPAPGADGVGQARAHVWMLRPEEFDPEAEPPGEGEGEPLGSVVWRDSGDALVIEVRLHHGLALGGGIAASAFGFRPDRPFAQMPKLRVSWAPGWLRVYDQGARVVRDKVKAVEAPGLLTLTIPWEELAGPEAVFVQVEGSAGEMPAGHTGWRLLLRAK